MSAEAPEAPVLEELVHDGYVVPTYEGGPVAGGFVDVAPATLDTHVTRRLVPTERQLRGGEEVLTEAIPVTFDAELSIDKPSLRARTIAFLREADPRLIQGPKTPYIVFGLIGLLGGWDTTALGLAQPEIQADFGLSVVGLAQISAVVGVITLIIGLPLGYLVDRIRKRVWLVRISAVANNLSDIGEALSPGAASFTAAGALGGFASIPGSQVGFPLLADYYASGSRARVFSVISLGGLLGGLISGPIARRADHLLRLAAIRAGVGGAVAGGRAADIQAERAGPRRH